MIVLALALLRARSVRARAYLGVKVLAEGHRRPDYTAQVEDGPEDTDEPPLLALSGVTHHERALCRPQQTSADTEDRTSPDDEAACVGVHVQGPVRSF